jgi:hypothetical protein
MEHIELCGNFAGRPGSQHTKPKQTDRNSLTHTPFPLKIVVTQTHTHTHTYNYTYYTHSQYIRPSVPQNAGTSKYQMNIKSRHPIDSWHKFTQKSAKTNPTHTTTCTSCEMQIHWENQNVCDNNTNSEYDIKYKYFHTKKYTTYPHDMHFCAFNTGTPTSAISSDLLLLLGLYMFINFSLHSLKNASPSACSPCD